MVNPMLNSLRSSSSFLLALAGLAPTLQTMRSPVFTMLPPFRMPRVRTSKTYGSMPFDPIERATWNRAICQRNRAAGKKHI